MWLTTFVNSYVIRLVPSKKKCKMYIRPFIFFSILFYSILFYSILSAPLRRNWFN